MAYGQNESVFDDDPMQIFPIGMEPSQYELRYPTGEGWTGEPRVEPMHWWIGMEEPSLELLIYDKGVARYTEASVKHPGVRVEYVRRLENPNYLFLGLIVSPGARAGSFPITLSTGGRAQKTIDYRLENRPTQQRDRLSSKDLMYLIMPDRFANGNPDNDVVAGTQDELLNREKFLFRHGGDLQGVIDHLNYLEDLGVTALWLNPVQENDQPYSSYHGYAVTDHYQIDPRLGTNEDYKRLVEAAHARGIKVVMDVIFNHFGDRHYQFRDLPSQDWVHWFPEYTRSNFRAATIHDPYAADVDRRQQRQGWFDNHMPDLNGDNPHLANYLIQNSIWWTIYSGQDAFRIDTYTYPDTKFMAEWNRRMKEEFPDVHLFGETWVPFPGIQAWFVGGQKLGQDLDTHLPGVTDFQVHHALIEAVNEKPSWEGGVTKLYYTLTQDYLYPEPFDNVTFLDNHDESRLFSTLGKDVIKLKSALALLLTTRGIPCLYYGTELLLEGAGGAFGEAGRVDFPGGFPGDPQNAFTAKGRTAAQNEVFDYLRTLARFRKDSPALQSGSLTQYVPRDGVYVYFRRAGGRTVMVAYNGNDEARTFSDLSPYRDNLGGFTAGEEVTNEMAEVNLQGMTLGAKEAKVILLR